MNWVEAGQEGVRVEAKWADKNLPTDPEASLLLDGGGGAIGGLGNACRVEMRSEKAAPLGGAKCKEFGIWEGNAVK